MTTTTRNRAEYYTCVGEVRGACGVHHRTYAAADRHCEQDGRAVRRGHGPNAYSDRQPRRAGA